MRRNFRGDAGERESRVVVTTRGCRACARHGPFDFPPRLRWGLRRQAREGDRPHASLLGIGKLVAPVLLVPSGPWSHRARSARATSSILFSWNRRMAAMPAAPAFRHDAAFSRVTPPRARTGIFARQASCKAASPPVACRSSQTPFSPTPERRRRSRLSLIRVRKTSVTVWQEEATRKWSVVGGRWGQKLPTLDALHEVRHRRHADERHRLPRRARHPREN